VVLEHPDAHAHKIARLVADGTQPESLHDFYVTALEPLVADRLRLDRNSTMNSKQGRSPKLEQRRSWWARMLRERVHVGEAKWMPLGDCGVTELDFCISERNDQVGALLGQIAKYQTIRDAVISHGVEKVAELPEGAVEL
jgi:hypothetical protein